MSSTTLLFFNTQRREEKSNRSKGNAIKELVKEGKRKRPKKAIFSKHKSTNNELNCA